MRLFILNKSAVYLQPNNSLTLKNKPSTFQQNQNSIFTYFLTVSSDFGFFFALKIYLLMVKH